MQLIHIIIKYTPQNIYNVRTNRFIYINKYARFVENIAFIARNFRYRPSARLFLQWKPVENIRWVASLFVHRLTLLSTLHHQSLTGCVDSRLPHCIVLNTCVQWELHVRHMHIFPRMCSKFQNQYVCLLFIFIFLPHSSLDGVYATTSWQTTLTMNITAKFN